MQLIAYVIDGHDVDLRPAPVDRDWMEATGERFAYRCLPLNIANAHGWEIGCAAGFTAHWTGGQGLDAIEIRPDPGTAAPVVSHFGYGILTFHVPCIMRTPPGYDLMVQGPINRPRDAIAPLSGVVETDWAPYTFTMNWAFTHAGVPVRFERGEPFCHLFPVKRGELESFEPVMRRLSDDADLKAQHETWARSRATFNAELHQAGSEARTRGWQKHYYRGIDPTGRAGADDHRTRVRLRPFRGR
jgi:hypothetical protein